MSSRNKIFSEKFPLKSSLKKPKDPNKINCCLKAKIICQRSIPCPRIKPAPMVMFSGTLPLIAVVQIMMLLELLISFTFCMVFIVLNNSIWYLMIPLPIAEIILTLVVFWDSFIRVNKIFFILKSVMALLYFTQQIVFVALQDIIIDKKYQGANLSAYYIVSRTLFDIVGLYFIWSFVGRKDKLFAKVAPEKILQGLSGFNGDSDVIKAIHRKKKHNDDYMAEEEDQINLRYRAKKLREMVDDEMDNDLMLRKRKQNGGGFGYQDMGMGLAELYKMGIMK